MTEKKLENLNDLELEVNSLRDYLESNKIHESQARPMVLFRGQRNAEWELSTTLERYTQKNFSVREYNRVLCAIAPAITAYTGKDWHLEEEISIDKHHFLSPPNYHFMTYVRHHGFPSPLIDWTQSLYIALFFAYQNVDITDSVSIYSYVESLKHVKTGWAGSPQISLLGPYVKTHMRHFSQQTQYTVAVKKINDDWNYCPHKEAFAESEGLDQDLVYKFILPGSLKNEVLTKLHEMNINAFTLFSNEESLMDMLAYKEITMRNL